MTKMKLLATAALTISAAALAAPAHAEDSGHWTTTGTARCAEDLAVLPVANAVSPLPLHFAGPTCGEGSLIRH
ncbi:hypothetical protein [Streptomyces camelliae]|uniref:Chaplin domain-containing protein n=1 Tax=Streptomyces camelliae TaxID=3004093 RepID=A0ABY7P756_9ACTN|nr:hypothetical protein [Streptomyces sp. HUAS 2-6]WBO65517.1 hypothetical protein O1G22_23190 [Streptomyces sp. HUAS 2-6]